MTEYVLIVTETKNKAGIYHYQVFEQKDGKPWGPAISERRSNREYVACTIDGQYYFGRLDLIGKGDHGKQIRWQNENQQRPTPIAYKGT